ncbi:MAG: hypothetical protein ACXAD7_15385 [Candidatus Kariarchaeaceae archaeon]|jgi:hypothetical protein
MPDYKISSLIQSILIIVAGISVVDSGTDDTDFKINDALFDEAQKFWNLYAFWAYLFFIVAIFQLIKSEPNK